MSGAVDVSGPRQRHGPGLAEGHLRAHACLQESVPAAPPCILIDELKSAGPVAHTAAPELLARVPFSDFSYEP
jgi:hypothetical protein